MVSPKCDSPSANPVQPYISSDTPKGTRIALILACRSLRKQQSSDGGGGGGGGTQYATVEAAQKALACSEAARAKLPVSEEQLIVIQVGLGPTRQVGVGHHLMVSATLHMLLQGQSMLLLLGHHGIESFFAFAMHCGSALWPGPSGRATGMAYVLVVPSATDLTDQAICSV